MRKLFLSLASLPLLALLIACGSSHSGISIPPDPSGGNAVGFSNASLSGTYVFNVHGVNRSASFATVGSFAANGDGTISGGTRDTVNDLGSQSLNEAIANTSTYFINIDGRGQIVLNGPSGRSIYRVVMESPGRGTLFQDGTTSDRVLIDAVGTIELQSGSPAVASGPYIVRLDGEDPNRNVYGAIGGVSLSGLPGSSIDENDAGIFTPSISANGSMSLSGTRGTATITTLNGINAGTHHFIVYFVSAARIEMVSTDRNFFLYGHAEVQSSFAGTAADFAADAPQQVFSLTGFDLNGARVEMGRATLDSSGSLTNGVEDISTTTSLISGATLDGSSFAVGANGRWTASLVSSAGAEGLVGWQVSPQRSIVLTTDSTVLETGVMLAQTLGLSTADVSGDFAEELAGFKDSTFSNVELVGNLRLDGAGGLAGTFDAQSDDSGLSLDTPTNGSYAVDATSGRSTSGTIQGLPVALYAVDPHTAFFLPLQQGFIYEGELVQQQP